MTESVEDILARSVEGHTPEAVAAAHARLQVTADLLARLVSAARPEEGHDDWKLIYEAVFQGGPTRRSPISAYVREVLEGVGREFPDWFDPDEGYREDVMAWKHAFDDAFAELTRDLEAMQANDGHAGPACR